MPNRVLAVVLDGVGVRQQTFGNAFALAHTPALDFLMSRKLYRTIKAHGRHVGLPTDKDIGNSEVGHNILGSGKVFDQGAKLVDQAISSGRVFNEPTWLSLLDSIKSQKGTLHLIGLLSDGNVHSHNKHFTELMSKAYSCGIKRIRLHVLLDGRDVGPRSAEKYVQELEHAIAKLNTLGGDVKVASGGGRMAITMDRYQADWSMVERGWKIHVLGEGRGFSSLSKALLDARKNPDLLDQDIPGFVIKDSNGIPVGEINDGDGVVFTNFRGDRAIEISQAFENEDFPFFDRIRRPKTFYAGMMQYDGDLNIPSNYLVSAPVLEDTLSEHLLEKGSRLFACSETQKFGHVTYFWNGNRSGYLDQKKEEYLEIPSDPTNMFHLKPWMKAFEITNETIARMEAGSFDFARINYPNGDMVGHTGNLEASIVAMSIVDSMLFRLMQAAQKTSTILVITADHGNCDEMFEDGNEKSFPNWRHICNHRPQSKTAHTISPVPFAVYDPSGGEDKWSLMNDQTNLTLGNVANSILVLMGYPQNKNYLPALLKRM